MKDVFLFTGSFSSFDEALEYVQEYWPSSSSEYSFAENDEVEEIEPIWRFRDELGLEEMEGWAIETLFGETKEEELKATLTDSSYSQLNGQNGSNQNTFVLVYEEALAGNKAKLKSTKSLDFIGRFQAK